MSRRGCRPPAAAALLLLLVVAGAAAQDDFCADAMEPGSGERGAWEWLGDQASWAWVPLLLLSAAVLSRCQVDTVLHDPLNAMLLCRPTCWYACSMGPASLAASHAPLHACHAAPLLLIPHSPPLLPRPQQGEAGLQDLLPDVWNATLAAFEQQYLYGPAPGEEAWVPCSGRDLEVAMDGCLQVCFF